MAELSDQTEAIIERLKAEGQLIRNTGTNSIKSMKVDINKFTGVMAAVRDNTATQVELMRIQLGIKKDELAAIKRGEQLAEVEKRNQQQQGTSEKPKPTPPGRKDEKKGIADYLSGALGTFKGILLKTLIGGGAGIALFEITRGFVDERTNGGFTRFFEEVDWSGMTDSFVELSQTLPSAIQSVVNFLNNPIGALIGAAGTGAAVTGVGLLGRAFIAEASDNALVSTRRNAARNFVKGTALGLIATGVAVMSPQIKSWIESQEWADNPTFIDGVTQGDLAQMGVDVANGMLQGAAMGAFFGPTGMLVGAILGATVVLGFKAYEFWQSRKRKNEQRFQEEMDALDALMETDEGSSYVNDIRKRIAATPEGSMARARLQGEILNSAQFLNLSENQQNAIKRFMFGDNDIFGDSEGAQAENAYYQQLERIGGIRDQLRKIDLGQYPESAREGLMVRLEEAIGELGPLARDAGFLTGGKQGRSSGGRRTQSLPGDPTFGFDPAVPTLGDSSFTGPAAENYTPNHYDVVTSRDIYDPMNPDEVGKAFWNSLSAAEKGRYENQARFNAGFNPTTGRLVLFDAFGTPYELTNEQQKGPLADLLMRGTNLMRDGSGNIVVINQGDNIRYGDQITGGTSLAVSNAIDTGSRAPGEEWFSHPGFGN